MGLWDNVLMDTKTRFFQKVVMTDKCWLWTGSTNGVGYGEIRIANKKVYAHRYSYEMIHGPIPEGMEVDHLCRNRLCVNPAHLEAVTHKENVRRGLACGPRPQARKTHCSNGHELNEKNRYHRPDGRGDNCVECVRIRSREFQRKKRAERLARKTSDDA